MKTMCNKCGCHFKEDFDKTLKCGYWISLGLGELSRKNKKILWDWFFSLPQDRIYLEDSIEIGISLYGRKDDKSLKGENKFKKYVPNYDSWSEEKRKDFQKEYFKFMYNISQEDQSLYLLQLFASRRGEKK